MEEYLRYLIRKITKIFGKYFKTKGTQLNIGAELKQQKSEMTELGENKMQISDEGMDLVKAFEGLELEAYQCAAGVWTIGYGYTKEVQEGDTWSEEKAEYMLRHEFDNEYENAVNACVKVPLNQCQFDALCSFF